MNATVTLWLGSPSLSLSLPGAGWSAEGGCHELAECPSSLPPTLRYHSVSAGGLGPEPQVLLAGPGAGLRPGARGPGARLLQAMWEGCQAVYILWGEGEGRNHCSLNAG